MASNFVTPANSLPIVTVLLDRKGIIKKASPTFSSLCGYALSELSCISVFDLVPLAEHFGLKRYYERITARNLPAFHTKLRIRHKDGRIIWLTVSAANHLDDPQVGAFVVLVYAGTLSFPHVGPE